jgi:iron(III) transport system permease protein
MDGEITGGRAFAWLGRAAQVATGGGVDLPTPGRQTQRTDAFATRLSTAFSVRSTAQTVVFLVVAGLVVAPVLFLIANSFQVGRPGSVPEWSLANWQRAIGDSRLWTAVWNSIRLYLAISLFSWPTAILVAWILGRSDIPGKHLLEFLFWLAFFLPGLSVVMGWIVLIDPSFGILNQLIRRLPFVHVTSGPLDIYTFWGLVWVHLGQNAIALKVILLTPAFRNMDATLEEAAQVTGQSALGTLRRITLPLVMPTVVIVFLLGFVRLWQSFEVERVLGVPQGFYVYGTRIYDLLNQSVPDYGAATVLSCLILIAMFPFLVLQRRLAVRRSYETVTSKFKPQPMRLGRARWPVFAGVLGIALVVSILPMVSVTLGTFMKLFGYLFIADPWTLAHWRQIFSDPVFLNSLKNTLILAGGAATLSAALLTITAYILVRTRFWLRAPFDVITWFPQALPGILLGLGFLWLALTPLLRPLYGTILLLILVTVIGSMTVGVQIVKGNILQLGKELEEAAQVCGATWGSALRRVVLPLLAPTIALVGTLTFVSASRDVSNIILLSSGQSRTLALLQLDYMVAPQWESAAVVSVILIAMSTGVALAARGFGLRMSFRSDAH